MKQRIYEEKDIQEVRSTTQKIVGEPCLDVYIGYADELKLHAGDRLPTHPKLKRKFEGSWILKNSSNYWELYHKGEEISVGQKEKEEILEDLKKLANTTITGFDISYPELILTISFSNDYQIKLYPDDDEYDLPYWELFTPGNMVLTFGPHKTWSYEKSDVPIGDKSTATD